jgi:hypothetical protein
VCSSSVFDKDVRSTDEISNCRHQQTSPMTAPLIPLSPSFFHVHARISSFLAALGLSFDSVQPGFWRTNVVFLFFSFPGVNEDGIQILESSKGFIKLKWAILQIGIYSYTVLNKSIPFFLLREPERVIGQQ